MVTDATQELKGWWSQLSLVQKVGRACFVAFSFIIALAAKVQGWTEVPSRLTAVENALVRQDSTIRRLERGERRAEYLFCVDLADRNLTPKNPQECFQDYVQGDRP